MGDVGKIVPVLDEEDVADFHWDDFLEEDYWDDLAESGYAVGSYDDHTHYCSECYDNWWCEVVGCDDAPWLCADHDEGGC